MSSQHTFKVIEKPILVPNQPPMRPLPIIRPIIVPAENKTPVEQPIIHQQVNVEQPKVVVVPSNTDMNIPLMMGGIMLVLAGLVFLNK